MNAVFTPEDDLLHKQAAFLLSGVCGLAAVQPSDPVLLLHLFMLTGK